jgi:hypothetical protein
METSYTWTAVDDAHTRMALRNRGQPAGLAALKRILEHQDTAG